MFGILSASRGFGTPHNAGALYTDGAGSVRISNLRSGLISIGTGEYLTHRPSGESGAYHQARVHVGHLVLHLVHFKDPVLGRMRYQSRRPANQAPSCLPSPWGNKTPIVSGRSLGTPRQHKGTKAGSCGTRGQSKLSSHSKWSLAAQLKPSAPANSDSLRACNCNLGMALEPHALSGRPPEAHPSRQMFVFTRRTPFGSVGKGHYPA